MVILILPSIKLQTKELLLPSDPFTGPQLSRTIKAMSIVTGIPCDTIGSVDFVAPPAFQNMYYEKYINSRTNCLYELDDSTFHDMATQYRNVLNSIETDDHTRITIAYDFKVVCCHFGRATAPFNAIRNNNNNEGNNGSRDDKLAKSIYELELQGDYHVGRKRFRRAMTSYEAARRTIPKERSQSDYAMTNAVLARKALTAGRLSIQPNPHWMYHL